MISIPTEIERQNYKKIVSAKTNSGNSEKATLHHNK
jgi:hypothetical protein